MVFILFIMKTKFFFAAIVGALAISVCGADAKKAEAPAQQPTLKAAPKQDKGLDLQTGTAAAKKDDTKKDEKAAAPQKRGGIPWDIIIMVGVFGLMFFLMYRSNKKQQQKRQEMLDRVIKGAKVMLNSGVYGKIVEVRDDAFVVEIAPNVNVLVIKNGIASVEDEAAESKESK